MTEKDLNNLEEIKRLLKYIHNEKEMGLSSSYSFYMAYVYSYVLFHGLFNSTDVWA